MAANPKKLRVVSARFAGPMTRVLDVECVEGGAFDVVGGKYVIVHTGITVDEKAIKRAYSLMPAFGAKGRARIAVKRLSGPGSNALHEVPVGAVLGFSGPWGKLLPEGGLGERTLLVATDTGITSALGIVEEHALAGREARPLEVLWLRASDDWFFDVGDVRARVERAGVAFTTAEIPAVFGAGREEGAFRFALARARELEATHVIATGDGAIVHPLVDRLPSRAPSVKDVRIECFFRNPAKKSDSIA